MYRHILSHTTQVTFLVKAVTNVRQSNRPSETVYSPSSAQSYSLHLLHHSVCRVLTLACILSKLCQELLYPPVGCFVKIICYSRALFLTRSWDLGDEVCEAGMTNPGIYRQPINVLSKHEAFSREVVGLKKTGHTR